MRITIVIDDKIVNRIIQLGSKPQEKSTEMEMKEYFDLVATCGIVVCNVILKR